MQKPEEAEMHKGNINQKELGSMKEAYSETPAVASCFNCECFLPHCDGSCIEDHLEVLYTPVWELPLSKMYLTIEIGKGEELFSC